MKTLSTLTLLICLYSGTLAAEPTPAPSQRFALPLSDGTSTQAVFLAAPKNAFHLVYATKSGTLIFLNVTKPGPEPEPIPPEPIPPAEMLKVAVINDPAASTPQQRQIMADPAWRDHIPTPHEFCGIIPFGLIDPTTGTAPAEQAPFLKAAEGHALPCLILLNENGKPVFVGPLPDSAKTILELIRKHGGNTHERTDNRRKQLQTSPTRTTRPTRTRLTSIRNGLPAQAI